MNPDISHCARRTSVIRTLFALCIPSLFALHASLSFPFLRAETIDLAKTVIVKPSGTPSGWAVKEYAANELQAHLQLISGTTIEIIDGTPAADKFPIYVGIQPASDTNATFATEEARWVITGTAVWLYGHDSSSGSGSVTDIGLNTDSRTGTLWAVYEFLENHAGIRWVEPGDNGIVYTPKSTLTPPDGTGSWIPQLIQRRMRYAYSDDIRDESVTQGNIPLELKFSDTEFQQRQQDERIWQRRHRRGNSVNLSYGHAFQQWWDWYGKSNCDYPDLRNVNLFAMLPDGSRRPASASNPDRIKLCVSNPDTAKRVAHYHFYRNGTAPRNFSAVGYRVNAIENDSRDFCNCDDCKALDVVLPGEGTLSINERHLTDRYVWFVNRVHAEARALFLEICNNPGAATGYDAANVNQIQVLFYAYSRYNFPPRRETLNPGVFLFLLPNLGDPLTEQDKYFSDWRDMGANEVFHRPNDLCQDTGLPIGFEQHMFEKFRLCNTRLTLKGTDYDTCWGFWPTSGITNYIMMRAMYRPEHNLAHWENEYFSTFGNASTDIREYHTYWRQIWNVRIMNNREKIDAIMNAKDIDLLRTKVTHLTDQIYTENDFDLTDAMLARALTRAGLTAHQRARIETLKLANQHNRLKYRAVRDNCLGSPTTDDVQKRASSQALLNFRTANRLNLNINWENLIYLENVYEDNTGTKRLLGTEEANRKNYRETTDVTITANRQITSLADRPAITTITPSRVVVGDTITIHGSNFYDIDSIQLGGVNATTWTRVDASTITAVIPEGVPTDGIVSVITRGDRANSPVKYQITRPITALRPLTDQTVGAGRDLTLTVDTDGNIEPVCTWQVLAASPGATWTTITDGGKYSGITTRVLRIAGNDESTNGCSYRVIVSNGLAGELTSNAAKVTVQTDDRYPHPTDLAIDTANNIYVADDALRTIQRITSGNQLVPFAGSVAVSGTTNGTGPAARFISPVALSIAPGNQVVIADNEAGSLRLASSLATVRTLATGLAPAAIATDASGNTYVADTADNCIHVVTLTGVVTTIAGSPDDAPGHLDGTGTAARFNKPAGIAVAANGTVYVADTGNHVIRAIAPGARTVTTIAGLPDDDDYADGDALAEAAFNAPRALAIRNNTLYVADTGNSLIRKIDLAASTVSTLAGYLGVVPTHGYQAATGTHAVFDRPQGLALDQSGNLYVADTGNGLIRKISPDGAIVTIAPAITTTGTTGSGNSGSSGGGGAVSLWYLAAALALALARLARKSNAIVRAHP